MKTTNSMKRSKKNKLSENTPKVFYLCIIKLLKNHKNPSQISKILNISKQKLNPYIQDLKRVGAIKKISYGVWEVQKDIDSNIYNQVQRSKKDKLGRLSKRGDVDFFTSSKENDIRAHGFMFKLKIPKIYKWNRRKEYLDKINYKYKELRFNNLSITFQDRKIHLNNNSIIIYEQNSYLSEFANQARSLAIYKFLQLLNSLERKLKVSFKYKDKYVFKVCREHYGLIKNSLAKQYDKEGKKIQCYTDQGLWCIIDNSFNLHELEIHKDRDPAELQALNDTEGMQNYLNSMKRTEFKVTPEYVLDVMNGIQSNQLVFDNNMKSHLNVLDKLGSAVDELKDQIKLDHVLSIDNLKQNIIKVSDVFKFENRIQQLNDDEKKELEDHLFNI